VLVLAAPEAPDGEQVSSDWQSAAQDRTFAMAADAADAQCAGHPPTLAGSHHRPD
jgi:hypothetical protein